MTKTDKAVNNQKVFVRLVDVLYLQSEIHRLQNDSHDGVRQANGPFAKGLVRAAAILQLPLRAKMDVGRIP